MATIPRSPRTHTVSPVAGQTGPFLVGFRLFEDDALTVYEGTTPIGFRVIARYSDGFSDTAQIVLDHPATGLPLRIDGTMRPERGLDYVPTDPNLVHNLNVEFGRVWATLAELHRDTRRSVRTFTEVGPFTIQPGHLVIAAPGGGFEQGPDASDIAGAQGYAERAEAAVATVLAELSLRPETYGARQDGTDAAPAFREAIAYLAARGGGVLWLREGTYRLTSVETRTAYLSTAAGGGALVPATVRAPFFLPAGVSIMGPGRQSCTLDLSLAPTDLSAGIAFWDYSDGEVSGFRLKGRGATTGAAHGLHLSFLSSAAPHVNRNVRLRDLHIHDWASYGIGQQYGSPINVAIENVLIEDTGADGIDWKVRFGPGDPQDASGGVVLDRVVVRRPGQRVSTSISGLGIRGRAALSNIEVTGLKAGCAGIQMDPGTGQGDEFRQPSARSTLTNFYVEGSDPGQPVMGLNCFSSGPLVVSNGYLRGCQVHVEGKTATPTGWEDGPSISNVVVEGTRGYDAFAIKARRTQMLGCRSIAHKDYFEAKRGNLAAGQTTLVIPSGITGTVAVLKNDATLTSGYSVAGNVITLASAAEASDVFAVIQPSRRPYRIEAHYCAVIGGGADAYHTETDGMLMTSGIQAATMVTGFFDERFPAVQSRQTAAAVLEAISPNADEDLRLTPKGTGNVRFGTHTPGSDGPISGYVTIKDATGTTRKLAVLP